MKWGGLYGPEYVNKLYSMVRYRLPGELRFVCLTDNREDIRSEVECYSCPEIEIPMPHRLYGWRKLNLFAPSDRLFNFTGDWLYLDLDVLVTGQLDKFFEYQPEKSFIVMKNWTQPNSDIGNTSVYRFRVGNDTYLLDNLLTNHKTILERFNNSQTYISRNIKEINFWPDEWCILFKVQCVPKWPLRIWKTPVLPSSASVVAFPGFPNPHQALVGEWPAKPGRRKKFYKTIRPTLWIKDIWDEAEQALTVSSDVENGSD